MLRQIRLYCSNQLENANRSYGKYDFLEHQKTDFILISNLNFPKHKLIDVIPSQLRTLQFQHVCSNQMITPYLILSLHYFMLIYQYSVILFRVLVLNLININQGKSDYQMKLARQILIKHFISKAKQSDIPSNELSLLMNKINGQKRQKIKFLQDLIQQGTIQDYFGRKNINELEIQDIYFYLSKRSSFNDASRLIRNQMVKNNNLDVQSKFFTAKELGTLDDHVSQKHLINSFNQNCLQLTQQQFLYCLQKISAFIQPEALLNINTVQSKIQTFYGICYIESIYFLSKFIDNVNIDIQKIADAVSREKLKARHIYFLKEMITQLKFEEQNLEKKIDTLARRAIEQCQYEDTPNALDLLLFYPNLISQINIKYLSPEQYIRYLKAYPQNIKIHQIPQQIINEATSTMFLDICKERVKNNLDTPKSLVDNMKDYFTKDLKCIYGLFRFLEEQNIQEDQIWMNAENKIASELHLANEKKSAKVLEQYSIIAILRIMGFLAIKKQGSINFWKASFGFVYRFLQNNQKIKQMDSKYHKNFIIYIYQVFTHKTPNQFITEKVKQLTLLAFTIHNWRLKELLPLTISLRSKKIGDHQIWLGIQKKILSMNLQSIQDESRREKLVRILLNFSAMNRGSFKFWAEIRCYLTKDQRQLLQTSIKNQNSFAYSCLKM